MTGESNRGTQIRIAAYSAADELLRAHQITAGRITHEELRSLLVLAYLDGYGEAGQTVLDEAEAILTRRLS